MLTYIVIAAIKSLVLIHVLLGDVTDTVGLERKVVGRIQNRWGPTRVGPFGLLQPIDDGVKFILKEDLTPPYVYKPLFILAPFLAVVMALTSIAVIPLGGQLPLGRWSTGLQITSTADGKGDINIALLVLLGVTSIAVYGIALAGWSSNNKYSLLGSLRASAQMISYELSLGLSLVGGLLLAGSLSPELLFLPPLLQALLPLFWFALKVFVFIFVYIWVRGTLPRFRYDQLMAFGWKFLLPLAIANIIITSFIVAWQS